ncbi:MAG: YARHG domain-containing protein [Pedobacter sp.]|nr:YARHG domain-containing protein [Pedobacter sp.]MDQ8053531.1 YARHG domain-containing protein [Pedobacter sp.]
MKKFYILTFLSLILASCHEKAKVQTVKEEMVTTTADDLKLIGSWVGSFNADVKTEDYIPNIKINLIIKNIEGDSVSAQSVLAGNSRVISGKIIRTGQIAKFELFEPGNDKYDGKFTFEIANGTLKGFWEAFDKTIKVNRRVFTLTKKAFVYNADLMLPENDYYDEYNSKIEKVIDTIDGKEEKYDQAQYRYADEIVYKVNSSTHAFTEDELKNLKKLELEILRNTIYARHGLSFKKKGFRQFFDYVDWYIPVSGNVDDQLTSLERANIKLLSRFEQYATDSYDTFGR